MKLSKLFIPLLVVILNSSCASIVTRSRYPVDFNSNPQGAHLTIENRAGIVVFEGQTPVTVELPASAGYMLPEMYTVTYTQPGKEPVRTHINANIDGWYIGNLFLGGLIGMLIVDPLTGAMYKLPDTVRSVTIRDDGSRVAPRSAAVRRVETEGASGQVAVRRISDDTPTTAYPSPAPAAATTEEEWIPLGD